MLLGMSGDCLPANVGRQSNPGFGIQGGAAGPRSRYCKRLGRGRASTALARKPRPSGPLRSSRLVRHSHRPTLKAAGAGVKWALKLFLARNSALRNDYETHRASLVRVAPARRWIVRPVRETRRCAPKPSVKVHCYNAAVGGKRYGIRNVERDRSGARRRLDLGCAHGGLRSNQVGGGGAALVRSPTSRRRDYSYAEGRCSNGRCRLAAKAAQGRPRRDATSTQQAQGELANGSDARRRTWQRVCWVYAQPLPAADPRLRTSRVTHIPRSSVPDHHHLFLEVEWGWSGILGVAEKEGRASVLPAQGRAGDGSAETLRR